MEAVPKLPMIYFELKLTSENTHFGPKLKQYIAEAYRENPDSYANEMHQLESLRSAAVRPTTDDAGLRALYRYFCQLRAMQSRFPMAKGAPACINFVWKDLHASMNCTADIRFEMACILYNIGALHTQLGASEPRTSADSLKAACSHFQKAAWAFQCVKDQYPQPPGVDVSPDLMRLCQEICLAQGQECILDKSIQDTRKPGVVGSVATQVMAFYRNCLAILGPSTGTDNIHEIVGTKLYNYWHRYLSFKSSYIGSVVCLYQGINAEEQQKMGERVAFYQAAVDKLNEARKLAKYIEPLPVTQEALTFTNDVVEGKRKAAKNENEFIYHEEVPDKDLLADLKPVCLVKAMAINFDDPEISGPDIFARLIPMGAHEASSMYSEEKAKILRHVVSQVESKDTEIIEFMSSLQLDQLDVIDSQQKIPQEIVDRCAAMNAKTEIIQSLVDSMNNLAEIISDVEHALSECKNLIQEETAKEKEYQKVIGPRPPSIVQTELSREFSKYQEAHGRTNESNQVLHKAMTLHIANLRLLALPLDELEAKIPSVDNIEGLDRDTMLEMRRVVGKAREMQTQRATCVQQLRLQLAADDVTAALLARASQSPDEIFAREIEKHKPQVKIIEQNLAAQENIINKLTSLYASYGESRRLLSDVLRKRDGLINALITSYDTYEELLGKSQKGLEFYKKLQHNINQLLARLKSTCQVQGEERAQLLAKQTVKESPPPVVPTMKGSDVAPPTVSEGYTPKLKDYLPYMKSRGFCRSLTPQGPPEQNIPSDVYYPESIYPTSVRPPPVGSEATTDAPQMKYPDGYVLPNNPYNPYANQYAPTENAPYNVHSNYGYPSAHKSNFYDSKVEENSSTPYTPAQYSNQQIGNPHYNPYYTGSAQNTKTVVTDSPNPAFNQTNVTSMPGQYNAHNDMYSQQQVVPIPEAAPASYSPITPQNQADLAMSFGQMQVSNPKPDQVPSSYGTEYSHTYYSVHYPQVSTPNMATYSHAIQNSNTNIVPSQVPSDYNTLNYPYGNVDQTVPNNPNYVPPSNPPVSNTYTTPEPYSYASTSGGFENSGQVYPIYTHADSSSMYSTSAASSNMATVPTGYSYPEPDKMTAAALDAIDKPIKSHVTGQALSANYYPTGIPQYNANGTPNLTNYSNPTEQNVPQATPYPHNDQTNVNYAQVYQNHPGYTFNATSGGYDYNYGSQNSFSSSSYNNQQQGNVDPNVPTKDQNWPGQVYTSAGMCETLQSPSETPQMVPQALDQNNQIYYNSPYGYQTNVQSNEVVPNDQQVSSNYGANMNQSTYMQSGHAQDSSVTYSNNQVSSPTENAPEPNYNQTPVESQSVPQNYQGAQENYQNPSNYQYQGGNYQNPPDNYQTPTSNYQTDQAQYGNNQSETLNYQNQLITNQDQPTDYQNSAVNQTQPGYQNETNAHQAPNIQPEEIRPEVEPSIVEKPEPTEEKAELSTLDLLSDIDFSVELKPLTPEIKVPQISENAIKKPTYQARVDVPKPQPKVEEVIERPAKKDLFSDPSLLNKFTEEVKGLQKLVDKLSSKMAGGLTLLDSKWKTFQDIQSKENTTRTKKAAMEHSTGNIVTEVVPYDDSRLKLKSNSHSYINASYFKQMAPWCIPLVISKCPDETEHSIFWKAVLENKITCIVCLLSDIEMQGQSYWPTAKGQSLNLGGCQVTLGEVTCTVHWTERKLTVVCEQAVLHVTHYQINVFPAKIVCSPLVLLMDKVLSVTYDKMSTAWIHCSTGAGRSSVVALLVMVMSQVRAGQINLCEMLDEACVNLCKNRTNVLEDTKFLADAYRAALFYAQGVLCSGTTSFNGEAVSIPTGASVLPPLTPTGATVTPAGPTASKEKEVKPQKFSRESFEEMKQSPGLKSGDMKDPLNFLDPLWSLKKK